MEHCKKRILILEDEALIGAEIKATLHGLGHNVVGVIMNGDRALDAIANFKPDVIFLDIHLKGSLNGIDIAHIIRKKYQIPFVFLTAFADHNTLEKAKLTLPYGYIVKPFNQTAIRVNLEMALFKHRMETEPTITRAYLETTYQAKLSEPEFKVLQAFLNGLSYKKTAEKCCISVNTVKSYQKKIYQLFEVHSKTDLMQKFS